jgi:hypothetical protein
MKHGSSSAVVRFVVAGAAALSTVAVAAPPVAFAEPEPLRPEATSSSAGIAYGHLRELQAMQAARADVVPVVALVERQRAQATPPSDVRAKLDSPPMRALMIGSPGR